MANDPHAQELLERLSRLEAENEALRAAVPPQTKKNKRGRNAAASVLIVLGVILSSVATVGFWARMQLVDTDAFVATFAPLAENPEVQGFLADQISASVAESLDVEGVVRDLVDGLATLDLPSNAEAALPLLVTPAVEGIHSMIHKAVENVISSPKFASLWEQVLSETHSRTVAVLQGDSGTVLVIDGNALALDIGTLTQDIEDALVAQGFDFAKNLPTIERTIPLLSADSIALTQSVYQLSVTAGFWLVWVVVAMLIAGVVVSSNRLKAVMWAGIGLSASFLMMAAGIGVGKVFFVGSLSPSIMPKEVAASLFTTLTATMSSTIISLALVSILIALSAWLAGASRSGTAIRNAGNGILGGARSTLHHYGLQTGSFGRFVDKWRLVIDSAAVVVALVYIYLMSPPTVSGVAGAVIFVAIVALVVELLRSPQGFVAETSSGADQPATVNIEMETVSK